MNYKLAEVEEFTKRCLGTRFRLNLGAFVDEEVTVVGYTDGGCDGRTMRHSGATRNVSSRGLGVK